MIDVPTGEFRIVPVVDRRTVPAPPSGGAGRNGDLRVEALTAWFGQHCVLADVDLRMPGRRVSSILGPSGAGKSTFLRTLSRMHELVPSAALAGEVRLDGAHVYAPGVRPAMIRLEFGTVFPRPNPFPGMSVRANVLSCLRLAGLPCGDSAEVLETSLRQAGLWAEVKKRLRAPAGALSSGQQQRLCIARALAAGPRVLLMDDPCSTLDRPSALRVEEVIREISAQVTVVLATRDVRMAARVSDHTAFFLAEPGRPARIVESGPARSVLVAPKDPRTATYIAGRSG